MLRRLFAALWCLLAATTLALASDPELRVGPDEARRIGIQLVMSGRNQAAWDVAEALLSRDPGDFQALLVKSRAARNLGQNAVATKTAREAWRIAATEAEKYNAAMVLAQALASDGKRTRAQLWLRRATDIAPTETTRNAAIRDFRYVRARNPWTTEFNFNIGPNDNINNGSRRETTELFGLPFEFVLDGAAQALEGVEYAAGVATRYRFDQSQFHAQDLVFQLSHRTYGLSADAQAQAPGVSGSDFAFSHASIGYVYRRTPEGGLGPYSLSATYGQSWYGGAGYNSALRLGGTQQVLLGPRARLTFSASGERQFGDTGPSADVLRGDVRLVRKIGTVGALGLSLGGTGSESDTDSADYREFRTGVDFALSKPVLGARVSFGLRMRQRDYPRSQYDPTGRDDREISASVNMVFTQIDRYGFNPTMSIVSSMTESNIGLFDSDSLGVRFGLRSAF